MTPLCGLGWLKFTKRLQTWFKETNFEESANIDFMRKFKCWVHLQTFDLSIESDVITSGYT